MVENVINDLVHFYPLIKERMTQGTVAINAMQKTG